MPEGVEVRKFVDILIHNIVGHKITAINILKGRYVKKAFDGIQELLNKLPMKVASIQCKGKLTYMELVDDKGGKIWLINTLGLTGGWTVSSKHKKDLVAVAGMRYLKGKQPKQGHAKKEHATQGHTKETEYIEDTEDARMEMIYTYPVIWEYISNNNLSEWFEHALNHLNVEFILDNGLRMYFYDQLSFGTLKIINTQIELDKKLKELGADLLDKDTTFETFKKAITKGGLVNKNIGVVIVNQKVVSGIGNYLRADALWLARVSPFRKVGELSESELERIYKSVRALMWGDYNREEALQLGYVDKEFKTPHDYERDFFVYRQETDINGRKVEKQESFEGSQKRFIYWVPTLQF